MRFARLISAILITILLIPASAYASETNASETNASETNDLETDASETNTSETNDVNKVILFGDSYGRHPRSAEAHWHDEVKSVFGIPDENVITKVRSGSGFTVSKKKKNFVAQIRKMSPDASVNMILIVGGVRNDMHHSKKYTKARMTLFNEIARRKFPNATIYYAIPNWSTENKKIKRKLLARKRFCNSVAKSLHWKRLKKTEKCLYKVKRWYEKDRHHPNKKGQRIISKSLIKNLKKFTVFS